MREILFRGKRIDNGEWIEGYYFRVWDDHYICWGTTNGDVNKIQIIPETVGQYTGMKDKNGKEIYEGDIILDDSISFVDFGVYFERSKFSVKYNQATCEFMRFNEEHKTFSGNIGLFSKENLEIIGNIHEGEVHP